MFQWKAWPWRFLNSVCIQFESVCLNREEIILTGLALCLNSVRILSEFRQIQTISGFWKKTQGFSIENKDVGRFEIYYNFSGASNNHSYFPFDPTEILWKSIISAGLALCLNSVWILSEFRQIQTISGFTKKTQEFPMQNKDVGRFEIYYNSNDVFLTNSYFSLDATDF